MMSILLPEPDGTKTHVMIVLEQANLDRIKQHDNAELPAKDFMYQPQFKGKLGSVIIAYATPAEMKAIQQHVAAGDHMWALKLLSSGYTVKPEDHDNGPAPLVPNA